MTVGARRRTVKGDARRARGVGGLARLGCALVLAWGCGARTGLGDEPYTTPTLYCPQSGYTARPSMPTPVFAGVPRYARGRATWEVTARPAGAVVTLDSSGDGTATFQSDTEGEHQVRVTVPARSRPVDGGSDAGGDAGAGETESCTLSVTVRAQGPSVVCPPTIETAPLRPVVLTGNASGDRPITEYRWTLEAAPSASGRPQPSPEDRASTRFTPDVAGDYRLRLTVTDEADETAFCTTLVRALPTEGIRVELFWNPPGRTCPASAGAACDSSDVDLHLLRGSRGAGWSSRDDCNWQNCNASRGLALSWDAAGPLDDPRLDLDDVDGHGPENINLDRPTNRSYRIGVHYYADHGADPQGASVLVYCGGATPVARFGPVVLRDRGAPEDNDFWLVADVLPTGDGSCSVRPITRAGSNWVTTFAEAQLDPGPPAP